MVRLLSASIFLLIAGPLVGQAPITSPYFPLEKGHKWAYLVTDHQAPKAKADPKRKLIIEVVDKVIYTGKDVKDGKSIDVRYAGFVLQSTSGDKVTRDHVFVSESGVHRFQTAGTPIDPPFLFFKFGLKKLGESWDCHSTNGDKSIKGTCTLNQAEVSVPYRMGAKLQAITVSFKADDERGEIDYWFVKDVGLVKQSIKGKNLHIVLELQSENFVK